jgi:uncharacterized protein involved in high-affinity Fe2+ transport
VHRGHREISVVHVFSQPVDLHPRNQLVSKIAEVDINCLSDLAASVAENDCLGNGEGIVQITKSVQFPVLALNVHKELLDTLNQPSNVYE